MRKRKCVLNAELTKAGNERFRLRLKRLRFTHKPPNSSRFSNLNGSTNGLVLARCDSCKNE